MPKLLPLLVAALPLALGAQGRADTLTLPSAVVTATRLPGVSAAGTATTTVLLGDALRAEGVTHLADALRRVPGLSIARSSSFGSQTALFLRGGQSNYVRLLIDGVPVNDPGGVLDLGRITLDDIERVEVVRGPASVLYGSEAVTGVIQLFTRRGGERRTSAEVGGGSFGATRASLGASGRDFGVRWSLSGDHHGSDGILAYNNGYRNEGLATSLALAPTARTELVITGRFNGSRYQYPTGSSGALEDRDAERTEHRTLVGVDLGHRWTDRLDTRLQYAANTLHPRTNDGPDHAGDTLGFYGYHAASTVSRRLFDLRNTLRLGATSLTVGGEFSRDVEQSYSISYSEYGDFPDLFDVARENRAAYVQALGEQGRVSYSLGGRLDDNSAFGTFRTLRAAVGVQIRPGMRLRASAGNAFKAPSFFENFASGFTVGNRDLRPELSRSAELGAEAVLGRRTLLRVTGFTQRFRDLIQYTGAAPMGTPNYFNVAEANAGGLEVEATVLAVAGVDITAGYTWTDTRVVDAGFDSLSSANFVEGQRLVRRPTHEANVQLRRRVARLGDLTATVHHLGERDDRDFAAFPATPVELEAVTTLDVAAAIPLAFVRAARTQLLLRAENVANTPYQRVVGFASPGRVLYVGLKLER